MLPLTSVQTDVLYICVKAQTSLHRLIVVLHNMRHDKCWFIVRLYFFLYLL